MKNDASSAPARRSNDQTAKSANDQTAKSANDQTAKSSKCLRRAKLESIRELKVWVLHIVFCTIQNERRKIEQ
jgi:hypothetical protein